VTRDNGAHPVTARRPRARMPIPINSTSIQPPAAAGGAAGGGDPRKSTALVYGRDPSAMKSPKPETSRRQASPAPRPTQTNNPRGAAPWSVPVLLGAAFSAGGVAL
jgi:hypothetical protein